MFIRVLKLYCYVCEIALQQLLAVYFLLYEILMFLQDFNGADDLFLKGGFRLADLTRR